MAVPLRSSKVSYATPQEKNISRIDMHAVTKDFPNKKANWLIATKCIREAK